MQTQVGGPTIALLLCAGRFDGLRAPLGATTLLRPFEVAAAMANHLGVRHALLCVPTEAQRPFAVGRWRERLPEGAVLHAHVLPEAPDNAALRAAANKLHTELPHGSALVLDFVGHPSSVADALRLLLPGVTVLDVGGAALAMLHGLLHSQGG